MTDYNPQNWYWVVGGDQSKVFSSASGTYVAPTDPTYLAWVTAGGVPTNIDTAANLGAVLAPFLARPTDATVLDGYTSTQAAQVLQHLMFKIAFNHENRIRALEGKGAITAQQAMAIVKALM